MPQAPVLRNTCHGPRTCIPQRAGCLPPHTDRVQQDIRPTDSPAPSAQKSGNTTKGATSKPTENEDDPRAQHAAVGAWDNYVDPHPDGDKPRPRDSHAIACPAATPITEQNFYSFFFLGDQFGQMIKDIIYIYLSSNSTPRETRLELLDTI